MPTMTASATSSRSFRIAPEHSDSRTVTGRVVLSRVRSSLRARIGFARMRRSAAALSATACLALSAGCGGTAPATSQADRQWIDNTAGVIDQLERDIQLESAGGDTVAAAREALRGSLYTVLVAYTDFGGCQHMVAAAGAAPARFG